MAGGASAPAAIAIAKSVQSAEQDGSVSHGICRVPGYTASLKSGKGGGDTVKNVDAPGSERP